MGEFRRSRGQKVLAVLAIIAGAVLVDLTWNAQDDSHLVRASQSGPFSNSEPESEIPSLKLSDPLLGGDFGAGADGRATVTVPSSGVEAHTLNDEDKRKKLLEIANENMAVTAFTRAHLTNVFGAYVCSGSIKEAEDVLGRKLTEAQFLDLKRVEAPLNEEAAALGELYAQELDFARRDVWFKGSYTIESKDEHGVFRKQVSGESRIKYDDIAVYYSTPGDLYPQLVEIQKERYRLNTERLKLCREFLSK